MLTECIKQLEKELELDRPLGAEGATSWAIALDGAKITIMSLPPGFFFSAQVGDLPELNQELFLVKMLRGNLFGQASFGSTIGLDDTGTKIILNFNYPFKPSYRDFKEKFEDFCNAIDFWKKEAIFHQQNPNTP
jgi:hypothetical protein